MCVRIREIKKSVVNDDWNVRLKKKINIIAIKKINVWSLSIFLLKMRKIHKIHNCDLKHNAIHSARRFLPCTTTTSPLPQFGFLSLQTPHCSWKLRWLPANAHSLYLPMSDSAKVHRQLQGVSIPISAKVHWTWDPARRSRSCMSHALVHAGVALHWQGAGGGDRCVN